MCVILYVLMHFTPPFQNFRSAHGAGVCFLSATYTHQCKYVVLRLLHGSKAPVCHYCKCWLKISHMHNERLM